MFIRIILVVFFSGAAGICYLAGLSRMISALLVGFGGLTSLFFGILFLVSPERRELWIPVHGDGASWPFFLLSAILIVISILFFVKKRKPVASEEFSSVHLRFLVAGFMGYLLNIFLAALLWFPSDEKRLSLDAAELGLYSFWGTGVYLAGTVVSLYLFYRASRGTAEKYPDLMRRIVLAIFSLVHFDKVPVFIAFLLVYSPETRIVYSSIAALALAAYIPVALFLLLLSLQSE